MTAAEKDTGIVNIHGKDYHTVAKRIADFRADHPEHSLITKVLSSAELVQVRAIIKDASGRTLATGTAEEKRGSTNINKTSALENAETSACGRALAVFGYSGTEIASADEIANAVAQQKEYEMVERLKRHNQAVKDNLPSILAMKQALAENDYSHAYACYQDLSDDDKSAITLAPTKGGIFTTGEVAQIKSNEWTAARREHHGLDTIDDGAEFTEEDA